MQQTLSELVEHQLLTLDEATELQAYLTADPLTYWQAPEALRDKAWQGLALLEMAPSLPH